MKTAGKLLENQVDEELQQALIIAEETPDPTPGTVLEHVYYSGKSPIQRGPAPHRSYASTWVTQPTIPWGAY